MGQLVECQTCDQEIEGCDTRTLYTSTYKAKKNIDPNTYRSSNGLGEDPSL